MAVYTLAEQARREQNPIRAGVMNVYAEASDIFKFLPIQSIGGNSYTYNTRTALPSVAFRGINESFVPSRGVFCRKRFTRGKRNDAVETRVRHANLLWL